MKITINDIELNLNIYDAEVAERLERETERLETRQNDVEKVTKLSTKIRKSCKIIFDFIDGVFGDGTSDAIFGESTDLIQTIKVYKQIIESIADDSAIVGDLTKEMQSLPHAKVKRSK